MSDRNAFDYDTDDAPRRPGQLSSNGQWMFGSLFAGLILVGFSFGVWAGASKSKPTEVADAKKDREQPGEKQNEKPGTNPSVKPPVTPPAGNPPVVAPPNPTPSR